VKRQSLRASAKINLDLRVLGRRADGYHALQTIFQTLELHDTVIVEPSRGPFVLHGDPLLMPIDRSNLVWRAAEALWRASGRSGEARGARVTVVKRIPAQAGLGGGSSDAAAALVGLSRAWRLGEDVDALTPVAAGLGADVPFFLMGGSALGLGRGGDLYPLVDRGPRLVVLVLPAFGVSTADAYRWLAEDRVASGWTAGDDTSGGPARNDLEAPVERRHPEIARIRDTLTALGAEAARMSGSGSAVFGLFTGERAARAAARRLGKAGYRVVVTRTRKRSAVETRRVAG
jgi:4-diphosphocytidyl-2-C-methyl-D-erythritol kinase